MDLREAMDDFLVHCEVGRYLSKKTVENYSHYLRRFLGFCERSNGGKGVKREKRIYVANITLPLLQRYRLFLNDCRDEQGESLSIKTQQYHLIALRAFLKFLAKRDIETLAAEKVDLPKVPPRTVEALQPEEMESLMATVDVTKRNGLRDLAVLLLLTSTGLRVGELSALNRDQVNLEKREFTVRGKGRKVRLVFMSKAARDALHGYLNTRDDNFAPLFLSNSNKSKAAITTKGDAMRLQPQAIQRIVRIMALKAGVMKKVTPHVLRHTFATELLRRGADIRSVQELLGHASITTTQIYTHLTDKRLREVYEKYHG
jgi:site-specific recombinase XerD